MQVVKFMASSVDYSLVAELWELGTTGLLEEANSLHAYFADETDLTELLNRYPHAIKSEIQPVEQIADKVAEPVPIGESFVVIDPAADIESSPYCDRFVLRLRAAGAFGSGRHESTQLVMEALENLNLEGATVLDVGCGTAITSEAARLLGASWVIACDTHFGSLQQAKGSFPLIPLFLGSVDAIAASSVDIVIANISASIIDLLSAELARITRPSGAIILGGFTHHRLPVSFEPVNVSAKDDWICWITQPDRLVKGAEQQPVQPFQAVWW